MILVFWKLSFKPTLKKKKKRVKLSSFTFIKRLFSSSSLSAIRVYSGKNTQNCTKKYLHNPNNHHDMITHLEPDILECEVKWALVSITTNKASGGDGIPVELFQILKDDTVKVLHSTCQHICKTAVATVLEKVSFHSNPKEWQCQRMLKLPNNCTHLTR